MNKLTPAPGLRKQEEGRQANPPLNRGRPRKPNLGEEKENRREEGGGREEEKREKGEAPKGLIRPLGALRALGLKGLKGLVRPLRAL